MIRALPIHMKHAAYRLFRTRASSVVYFHSLVHGSVRCFLASKMRARVCVCVCTLSNVLFRTNLLQANNCLGINPRRYVSKHNGQSCNSMIRVYSEHQTNLVGFLVRLRALHGTWLTRTIGCCLACPTRRVSARRRLRSGHQSRCHCWA